MAEILTSIPSLVWPSLPPAAGRQLLAVLYQIESGQWQPESAIAQRQQTQLSEVIEHAQKTVPFYQGLPKALLTNMPVDEWNDLWSDIPILKREHVQQQENELRSRNIPSGHGKVSQKKTSGSTGRPITALSTALDQFFWSLFTVREHIWQKRDLTAKLSAIRRSRWQPGDSRDGSTTMGWGPSTGAIFKTGPSSLLNIQNDVRVQADWLCKENPDYLITFPSNLLALTEIFSDKEMPLVNLKQVRTVGEVVTPQLRERCRQLWDVSLADMYSSQEVGYIALQCPDSEYYHIQSEGVFVEILDEFDKPCKVGETGRLVVTTLHNFAMPFIRYELGDYAEVGEPCQCGRGLPVINRILGRVRNMVTYPTGEKKWPYLGEGGYADIAPVQQYQIVQTHLDRIEARLQVVRALTAEEETLLSKHIQGELGYPFQIDFQYVDNIGRSANGKFEDFVSLLDDMA